ncbi:MAG: response regulator transcription factor [Ndongobacter sp.]|nr:response regulator transcription factor [Ndongobacter sp.]
MEKTVLLCDDDREIVQAIEIYLQQEKYRVLCAYDGLEALEILEREEVHLILLDLMMPRMDGLHAMQKIREERSIPIIIISAKSEDADKILGLTIGADDYITKPFNPLELVARVKSQLRRYTEYQNRPERENSILYQGGLAMDDQRREVRVDGELIALTPLEYQILALFMQHPGRVFTGEEIYERVWKEGSMGAINTVAVHIRHIREKIEIDPSNPRYLKVVWGVGYKLEQQR